MRYFEFGKNFEYYALIGTNNIDEAMEYYTEHICEEAEGEIPTEITKEEAREKLSNEFNSDEEKEQGLCEFDMLSEDIEPYLILVSDDLF